MNEVLVPDLRRPSCEKRKYSENFNKELLATKDTNKKSDNIHRFVLSTGWPRGLNWLPGLFSQLKRRKLESKGMEQSVNREENGSPFHRSGPIEVITITDDEQVTPRKPYTPPPYVPLTRKQWKTLTYGTQFVLEKKFVNNTPQRDTLSGSLLEKLKTERKIKDAKHLALESSIPQRYEHVVSNKNSSSSLASRPSQVFARHFGRKESARTPKVDHADLLREIHGRREESTGTKHTHADLPTESKLPAESTIYYTQLTESRKEMEEQIAKLHLGKTKEEEEEESIVDLDDESQGLVERYLNAPRKDDGQILGTAYRVDLHVGDLKTLSRRQWLNDNVIDLYLNLVVERATAAQVSKSFPFSTHFFSKLETDGYKGVMRWAKRKGINVTELDYVFVPINYHGSHWCLAVINNKDKKFQHYDSMSSSGLRALKILKDYMVQEASRVNGIGIEVCQKIYDGYEFEMKCACPQQMNGYDCGVFTCKNVERLSLNKQLNYSQDDMVKLRNLMAFDILKAIKRSKL